MRSQLRVRRFEEIGHRAVTGVSPRRRVERQPGVTRRAPAEARRGQIEILQAERQRQLQTVVEEPRLILREEGMAALRDVERGARRIRAFVAGKVSVALTLEFVSGGEQVRAAHPQINASRKGVNVAGEIADRGEGRFAEWADSEMPVQ